MVRWCPLNTEHRRSQSLAQLPTDLQPLHVEPKTEDTNILDVFESSGEGFLPEEWISSADIKNVLATIQNESETDVQTDEGGQPTDGKLLS